MNTETQSPHPVGSSAWLGRKIQYVIQTHIGSDVWSDWAFKDQALEVERRIESLKTERPHRTFRGVMRTITDEPLRPNAEVSDRRAHGNENKTGANGGSLH